MRAASALVAIVLASAPVAARAEVESASPRSHQGEALYQKASKLLERGTFDTRRVAIRDLEQATLLDPENSDYQLTLARAYYQVGFLKNARRRFEQVVRIAPEDARGRFGLGQTWRRDWLKYLDRSSLSRAVEQFSAAARLDPASCDSWLMLTPQLVEQPDLVAASNAAERAQEANPRRADALLAMAYTAYRRGRVARADSLFAAAIPRLPQSVRERFADISPVATARDTFILHRLSPDGQVEFVRRFWKEMDPDLSTPENEAQLEYWSRVAHAYFLFYDPKRREWDERGEVYVRYGAPVRARYNPLGVSLADWAGTPRNVLVWEYPDLGMKVLMEDRTLSEYYLLPVTRTYDPDPVPNPDSLALRTDAVATTGGRGVFPKLPPGVRPLPVSGVIARFEGEQGTRLLAHVESPGGPQDSLWAEWVVLDSTRREVHRAARELAPSACAATERRVADFAAELPPGAYLMGLSVRDGNGGRGVYRAEADLATRRAGLTLSDVVISCGTPDMGARAGAAAPLRIEPNPSGEVAEEDPLTAYFEIYRLKPGRDGQSRFEYVYTVKSAEKDPRIWLKRMFAPRPARPSISASREEENAGSLRRQFVSVPVQALPAGRYRLEVRVRDLVADVEAVRTVEFVKVARRGVQG